ncbi:MFS transporter [Mucilaginibacter terrae]|uniref:Multidrug resistance protein n=1 Tax=Mucilaginibacter terrae TaxID=1955052 RepID=A0ABU3GRU4_9SPHI|nr:MFS transporter [Mucilaginibacter terrae]MDT3402499.1 multidrug resistance protein [Mucilaginibacter terrae]
MKADKNLWILVFICVINSMGFGIIVPLLYDYGKKFGLNEQTIGILTASFSVAQFFATPLLGSLSDKCGRKPLLAISLAGTCLSFLVFAFAQNLLMLFAARILDGITGGNISVAQAMVSDSSTNEDRAKKFGILSSAFGFGFVIGPALGGLLSKFGMQVPFYFAAGIAFAGALLSTFVLKETKEREARNKNLEPRRENSESRVQNQESGKKSSDNLQLTNDSRLHHSPSTTHNFTFASLITAIKMPVIGIAVFTGFILTMAQFVMIIGFQTFSVDVLKINPTHVGLLYAGFGVTGIIMQLLVPFITKHITSKSLILLLSTAVCLVAMVLTGFTNMLIPFAGCLFIYGLFNGLRGPMLNAIIANHNDDERQGEILGVNQSYASLGQTIGPVLAGLMTMVSVHAVFFLSAFFILTGFLLTFRLRAKEKQNAR